MKKEFKDLGINLDNLKFNKYNRQKYKNIYFNKNFKIHLKIHQLI